MIHRLLTCDTTSRARAGRKDRSVSRFQNADDVCDVSRLQIANQRLGARGDDVLRLLRLADDSDHLVTARRQQMLQTQCDLTMPAGDDYAHASTLRRRNCAAPQSDY